VPLIKENDFKKHIAAKSPSNLYLLYGEEKFLVKHYTDILVKTFMGPGPSEFNFHIFSNDDTVDQIVVSVNIIPFIEKYNMVLITDLDVENLKASSFDTFMDMLKSVPDTTILVLSIKTLEVDSKKAAGKFLKLINFISKNGIACNFGFKSAYELDRQLISWAAKKGSVLNKINARLLADSCTNNLTLLSNELNKLCAYADGGEITAEMIEKLTVKSLQAKIYALSDAVLNCKSDTAFTLLHALFYQKEEPIAIVSILGSAYIDIYRARVAFESGVAISGAAEIFNYKNRSFALEKAMRAYKNLSIPVLRKSIDIILQTDVKLKTVSVNQKLITEKLITQLMLCRQESG